ncbi:hypothetical protein L2E82_50796 [Cichorium intybus]|nr:hypothetical protein L2E82_50796 [Cichorium intybus]
MQETTSIRVPGSWSPVLTLLTNWLEPLPDGSLLNINIRAEILKILTEFPIDLDQYDRREQLKKSGLGKVIIVDRYLTRARDLKTCETMKYERMPPIRRPSMKKPMNKASGDDDLDLAEYSHNALDFVVRPQSKIDPDEIRSRAKQVVQDQRRLKMNKRLQQLKAPKKKQLQATKLSVEGRGMVKYL